MASSLFQKLESEAFRAGITPRTKASQRWFRKKLSTMKGIGQTSILQDQALNKEYKGIVGNMYMYAYSAKHKLTLPYYDRFPLTIVVGPAKDGFYGLNLHYLPITLRAKFLDELLKITNNTRYNETTKFKLSYEMLAKAQKMRYFRPCFKHYLNSHVKSHFARISAPEYEIAIFLPTASWSGADANKVYADSRKLI